MQYLPVEQMGKSNLGWLKSNFHFSFAEYYNPNNIHFNALRVINHDVIAPNTGFDTHPHRDMEIVTYVINGTLTHADSMGNERTVSRGGVQYMSAGIGITHSEYNHGTTPLELLQIWIIPHQKNLTPAYGDHAFPWEGRLGSPLLLASGQPDNVITIAQDVNIYALYLNKGEEFNLVANKGRACYCVQIEGQSTINSTTINSHDAFTLQEEEVLLKAETDSHYLWLELAIL